MSVTPLLAAIAASLLGAPRPARVVPSPAVARPGDAVLVRVTHAPAEPAPSGSIGGRPLRFWKRGRQLWAVGALPIETAPGAVRIEVAWDGGPRAAAALDVVEPGFAARSLSVSPRFVEPPDAVRERIAQDQQAFAAAYDRPFVPPFFTASFGWPRKAKTSGRFGDQRLFNGNKESVHYGLDLRGARGAPVFASNAGEVVLARDCYYSGNTVVVWHGADLFTLYFHLDRISVRAGSKVRKGTRLGTVGSTGRSTGPHLHWGARVAGLLVDPESLLGIDFATGAAPPRRSGRPAPAPPKEVPPPAPPPESAAATSGAPRR